jgi:hypothetical protein
LTFVSTNQRLAYGMFGSMDSRLRSTLLLKQTSDRPTQVSGQVYVTDNRPAFLRTCCWFDPDRRHMLLYSVLNIDAFICVSFQNIPLKAVF